MALPAKPSTSPAASAPAKAPSAAPASTSAPAGAAAQTTPNADANTNKVQIKQFGPAKTDNGDVIPAPMPHSVNLVDLNKSLYAALTNLLNAAGVTDIVQFASEIAELDKTQFPGHKEGRVSYATASIVVSLQKQNGLLNKVRGASGGAVMKQKLAEKDDKIAKLEMQLAELMAKLK